jgi:hypothetical protein
MGITTGMIWIRSIWALCISIRVNVISQLPSLGNTQQCTYALRTAILDEVKRHGGRISDEIVTLPYYL